MFERNRMRQRYIGSLVWQMLTSCGWQMVSLRRIAPEPALPGSGTLLRKVTTLERNRMRQPCTSVDVCHMLTSCCLQMVSLRRPAHKHSPEPAQPGIRTPLSMTSWDADSQGVSVQEAPADEAPAAYAEAAGQVGGQEYGLGLQPVQTYFPQADRIVAIGDIHGDEGALIACLRMASCIDTEGNWCGGTTNVVQIGDILDRGDEERRCMDRLFDLKQQAAAAGGAVHVLMGNHEAMNVDWDFDYVGLGGFDGWESREQQRTNIAPGSFVGNVFSRFAQGMQMGGVPGILKNRAKAFTVGTGFAALSLSEMPLAIQIGDTVCVHGGLELKHLEMDLHQLNVQVSEWLRGAAPRPSLIDDEDAPIWNRAFSSPADRALKPANARMLEHVLHQMGASRMIVGHTPQVPRARPL